MITGLYLSPAVLITRLHILNHRQNFTAGDGEFSSSPSLHPSASIRHVMEIMFWVATLNDVLLAYLGIAYHVLKTFNCVSCEEKMVNLDFL